MKKFLLLSLLIAFASLPVNAYYPENEAEFLYNNKDNSSVKFDYTNNHNYIKMSDDMYVRDDGTTIFKNSAGIVESSNGRAYMPIGSGTSKTYVPMDL